MTAIPLTPGPGAETFSPELNSQLAAAVAKRTSPPRTRHLVAGTSYATYTNRLALEQSPYLLQHAHNPVDWRPWGSEAFDEARARDVPVFLSIGYATCHWCHVMEEESFEDEEIARLLNTQFVCIKIDREERPDVDAIYMQAVQLLSGQGGWPMTVFLDHQRRPFYAGTYFPPRDGARGSRHGLTTLANELARLFREERPRTEEAASDLAAAVKKSLLPAPAADLPTVDALVSALKSYADSFDPRDGGMRRAPKFPSSMNNRFLLRMAAHEADVANSDALKIAWLTLEKMALGGIFDQLGGGFHRYSTDARWLVPHFEKMLYDNALLTIAYVEAWQLLRDLEGNAPDGMAWRAKAAFFKTVAERTLHWMDAEMSDARGGFFSATDADSEGEEGTYFVWTQHEVNELLGAEDGLALAKLFDVSPEGNFEGKSILSLEQIPDAASQALLDRSIPKLLAVRAKRPPPLTDNKVLTAWNGLAISAFARAGFAFQRDDLLARAARAADMLLVVHRDVHGKLLRSSLDGMPRHPGLLEDHAFLAAGLVDLFEATGKARWLSEALALHASLEENFADPEGGYFRVPADHEALLAREKPAYDGAEPTGNSVAALTLLRLGLLTGDAHHKERAHKLLRSFGAMLTSSPLALGEMLLALEHAHSDAREVVLVRPEGGSDELFAERLREKFLPHVALIRVEEGAPLKEVNLLTHLVTDRGAINRVSTAYVCREGACGLPATTADAFLAQLK